MLRAHFLGGVIGLLALALPASAEPHTPFTTERKTITSPEVEVRCGQSAAYYPTLKLHRGDVVEVIKNAPAQAGWLAIKPPRGSFSWVEARLVRRDGPNGGTVVAEETRVLAGSSVIEQAPSVRTTYLARGAQVVILDKPLVCSDGSRWLPIAPHPSEVRYLPASALDSAAAIQTVSSKVGSGPAVFGRGDEPDAASQNPTFRAAEQAEARGESARAEQLYKQLAGETNDYQVRNLCQNRLAHLKQPASPAGNIQLSTPAAPTGTPAYASAPGTPATSLYGSTGQPAAIQPAADPSQGPAWTGEGWLARTDQQIDGKPVYTFCNREGQCVYHVIAPPGLGLDRCLSRRLRLYGQPTYRGDLRGYLLSASSFHLMQ